MVEKDVDLSYFNKYRAKLIKGIAHAIITKKSKNTKKSYKLFLPGDILPIDIQTEFGLGIDELYGLTNTFDPPNQISLIVELEQIKHHLKRIPTKKDIEENSVVGFSQYETIFGSWEYLLDLLEYTSQYSEPNSFIQKYDDYVELGRTEDTKIDSIYNETNSKNVNKISVMRELIIEQLEKEQNMLQLFNILEQNIPKLNKKEIEALVVSSINYD